MTGWEALTGYEKLIIVSPLILLVLIDIWDMGRGEPGR